MIAKWELSSHASVSTRLLMNNRRCERPIEQIVKQLVSKIVFYSAGHTVLVFRRQVRKAVNAKGGPLNDTGPSGSHPHGSRPGANAEHGGAREGSNKPGNDLHFQMGIDLERVT